MIVDTPLVSDFSMTTWNESLQYEEAKDHSVCRLVSILVTAAIAREEKEHPGDAAYYVLSKALDNHTFLGSMVSGIHDLNLYAA